MQEPWFDEPDFVRTSLAFLAGYLRQNSNFEIHCLDAKFERLSFEQLLERVVQLQPDLIGYSAFTNEIKPCAYVAAKVKQALPSVVNIIGGPHLTALPEVTLLEFPQFDVGVVGEGEQTFLELCRAIQEAQPLLSIPGLVINQLPTPVRTTDRERILDQDSIPIPAWDLFPPAKLYYIQTVRGCPFNCVFCMNHNGKVARKRSVELVIQEMEMLIQMGAQQLSFGDELFSVDMQRTHELLDQMIQHRIGERVKWDIQTHVAYVDDALFAKMKKAGIYKCEMGVEAGDENALKRMGKATNKEMIVKAFQLAHRHGIRTGSFLLIGQPNESISSIWKTIRLGIKINPNEPIIGTMVPYPGTEVSKMAVENREGYRLLSYDWDNYSKQINHSLAFNRLSIQTIRLFQIIGYTAIFLANVRIVDFIKFFFTYRVAALQLLQSVFRGTAKHKEKIPDDYHQFTSGNYLPKPEDLIQSRQRWKNKQSSEVKRTKLLLPELLVQQQSPVYIKEVTEEIVYGAE